MNNICKIHSTGCLAHTTQFGGCCIYLVAHLLCGKWTCPGCARAGGCRLEAGVVVPSLLILLHPHYLITCQLAACTTNSREFLAHRCHHSPPCLCLCAPVAPTYLPYYTCLPTPTIMPTCHGVHYVHTHLTLLSILVAMACG
jgi:hypothetical protein